MSWIGMQTGLTTMESNLPKFLSDLAAMDKLPLGAYVDLPDKSGAWFVESVQKLADEVYTVNHRQGVLFTGFEPVTVYFDVRNFAQVLREIMTHRVIDLARGSVPEERHFWAAQEDTAKLRKRLEDAYRSALQKNKAVVGNSYPMMRDTPSTWMFALAAYEAYILYGRRFDDVMRLSLAKLAQGASEIGQRLAAKAEKEGEAAYFYAKQ